MPCQKYTTMMQPDVSMCAHKPEWVSGFPFPTCSNCGRLVQCDDGKRK